MATEKNEEAQANPGPKGAYGVIHAQENQMRDAGDGVFEAKSSEAGRRRGKPRAKAEKAAD
ncbi:hypothetical protein [Novosphingobium sp. JCM 18896]|uniref:hypothetical protein n=1 Tax=Novosphingobium sp. JCM 18896 TaxID=2989731 RepID=UPI00222260B4|nr:hypothetical protein [Novosphingobium sp. JCM 18896]MCW1431393.1 hypothetical protein [Novosphingobium sp. JCM 18896]